MNNDMFLGIDLGTGGCKLTLINSAGDIIAEAKKEYPTNHPKILHSEQNPQDWIDALISALNIIESSNSINILNIKAVSLDASTHNAVILDENMNVIRPTIMWTDQRSIEEVKYLEEHYGDEIYNICYQKISTTWTLPQLLWIKNNEYENYKKISKIMFVKDYVRYWLTNSWETDYIDAQGTLLFDMEKQNWADNICNIINLDLKKLPPIYKPTDIRGSITSSASKVTGLKKGTPVIVGSSDSKFIIL
ncbi:MAG: FGGY family carbohydrate kinase, partial [Actinobacteria bacterium]|nr:FGGY family carbohydrate kinase [Actinomycetota bacterium]